MIVTTSHATIINGHIHEVPANTITETLKILGVPFILVRHSISGEFNSKAYECEDGKVNEIDIIPFPIKVAVLRYMFEVFFTVIFLGRRYHTDKKIDIFIGVDPLNALSGLVLKKIHIVKKVIFYSVDFSDTRFSNKLLNYIYLKIDNYCASKSDEVWNVSSRIFDMRKKMGIDSNKNIYIPNVPSEEYKKYLNSEKDRNCLVTLGVINNQMDFLGVFEALRNVRNEYPNINFKIIGTGPKEDEYKSQVKALGLEKNVTFLGSLDHDKALYEVSKSGIGLALYNGSWSFNYYGDSMKCREFFCFGLPVLTTDTHSTVEDIKKYKAGIVTDLNVRSYEKAIKNLILNYDMYSTNSYKISSIYEGIHLKNLKRLCLLFI